MTKIAPTKAQTALLSPFLGLSLESIHVPATRSEFETATAEIKAAGVVGFDTESKPTFVKDEKSEGPHIVQFALHSKAYIFQLHQPDCQPFLAELLASDTVLKVGFGLASDRGQIQNKLGVKLGGVLDLSSVFRTQGYRNATGVRAAVAIVFNQKFHKSKRLTTSNWAMPTLSASQLLYAANDAYAALKVQAALELLKAPPEFASEFASEFVSEPAPDLLCKTHA
jgi:ribonuclease D